MQENEIQMTLVTSKVTDVPKSVLKKLGVDAAVGRFDMIVWMSM